jgi:hypothetical protein
MRNRKVGRLTPLWGGSLKKKETKVYEYFKDPLHVEEGIYYKIKHLFSGSRQSQKAPS